LEKGPNLTDLERALLNEVQTGLPVDPEPFKVLGEKFGISEEEVLAMLNRFKEAGYIRRMGAIFDSRKLGYVSTLCAAKVTKDKEQEVAKYINQLTEVTHNYLREHEYNMWFTVIAHSKERLHEILNEMENRFGIKVLNLPAIRFFKINVSFDFTGGGTAEC
jgi:DNA-binding Lrp family transcriptional regulator